MKIQDTARLPHVEGHIHVVPGAEPGEPGTLELTTRTYEAPDLDRKIPRRQQHPLHAKLEKKAPGAKLRAIPVRVLFDEPASNVHVRFHAWSDDYSKGPSCIGNGEVARRVNPSEGSWTRTTCAGPQLCDKVQSGQLRCGIEARLHVMVEGQTDPLAVWLAASNSLNSYRSVVGTLGQLRAAFGGLRHLPLELALFEMASQGSDFQAFTCMKVQLRKGTSVDQASALRATPHAGLESYGEAALRAWDRELEPSEAVPVSPSIAMPPPAQGAGPDKRAGATLPRTSLFASSVALAQNNPLEVPCG